MPAEGGGEGLVESGGHDGGFLVRGYYGFSYRRSLERRRFRP
ncbi:hypothetical protein PCLA_03f0457 [Pseudomonas citronellolis]|nr:hypothetical protein PCLA_03f0457 [Pseudomonas citronellolis]